MDRQEREKPGAGSGTLIGAAFDLARAGIAGDFLEEVSEYLLPGKAAVITELDEEWQAPIDTRMETLGGTRVSAQPDRGRGRLL
jgi:uncharacterized membrane protein